MDGPLQTSHTISPCRHRDSCLQRPESPGGRAGCLRNAELDAGRGSGAGRGRRRHRVPGGACPDRAGPGADGGGRHGRDHRRRPVARRRHARGGGHRPRRDDPRRLRAPGRRGGRSRPEAVSLARTGAFFSNDAAPLSSRTVRFISGIHFPPGVRNTPNGALYGIELTNRGCRVEGFRPELGLTPSRSLAGTFGSASRRGAAAVRAVGHARLRRGRRARGSGRVVPRVHRRDHRQGRCARPGNAVRDSRQSRRPAAVPRRPRGRGRRRRRGRAGPRRARGGAGGDRRRRRGCGVPVPPAGTGRGVRRGVAASVLRELPHPDRRLRRRRPRAAAERIVAGALRRRGDGRPGAGRHPRRRRDT